MSSPYRYEPLDAAGEEQRSVAPANPLSASSHHSVQAPSAPVAAAHPAPAPAFVPGAVAPPFAVAPPQQAAAPDNSLIVAQNYDYSIKYGSVFDDARHIFKWRIGGFLLILFLQFVTMAISGMLTSKSQPRGSHPGRGFNTTGSASHYPSSSQQDDDLSPGQTSQGIFFAWLIEFAFGGVAWLLSCGVLHASFEYMRGKRTIALWSTFFYAFHTIAAPCLKVYIAKHILVTIGMYLFFFPGAYLFLAYTFVAALVVDRPHLGTFHILKLSMSMVNKSFCSVFGFYFFCLLVIIGGIFLCIVGIFPALVLVQIMLAVLYQHIFGLDYARVHGVPTEAPVELGPKTGFFLPAPVQHAPAPAPFAGSYPASYAGAYAVPQQAHAPQQAQPQAPVQFAPNSNVAMQQFYPSAPSSYQQPYPQV